MWLTFSPGDKNSGERFRAYGPSCCVICLLLSLLLLYAVAMAFYAIAALLYATVIVFYVDVDLFYMVLYI